MRNEAGADCIDVDQLYRQLSTRLEHTVRRKVRAPAPLIEDACQFAWWRLVVHAHRVERTTALPWLAKTAVHEALKLIRREERDLSLETRLERLGATIPSRAPGPDLVAEQHDQLALLRELPIRQRSVLVLQAAGLTYDEIAAQNLGLSGRAVERQILRGSRRLRAASRPE